MNKKKLAGSLLKSVSRSFYLSLKVLPGPMRLPVSLAYLLARISDTLADTKSAPVELRLEMLAAFSDLVQEENGSGGGGQSERVSALTARLKHDFVPLQKDQAEQALLLQAGEVVGWHLGEEAPAKRLIQKVLLEITRGQTWDLERFEAGGGDAGGGLRFCENAAELDLYTYQVAGCVGEFWTEAGLMTCHRFADAEERDTMMDLGMAYGKGLQLVNILRDLGEDLENGRCYLPKDELEAAGWRGETAKGNKKALAHVAMEWSQKARSCLESGLEYVRLVEKPRVRYATVLPMLIGCRTLALIERRGPSEIKTKVKVGRKEVQKVMLNAWLARKKMGSLVALYREGYGA